VRYARKFGEDAHLQIAVEDRDCGSGLSPDLIDQIFKPFYTTKRDGLGMGLSISRSIIEAHGGSLCAENNPDRGATFFFTIPTATATATPAPSPSAAEGPA
jgi:two-component system sensor kinase FixL